MLPVGQLMIEHRLIERVIAAMKKEAEKITREGRCDTFLIDKAIDFIRVYTDRCHHGKEEDILFRDLSKKKLATEHGRILHELVDEHVYGRKTLGALEKAKKNFESGFKDALKDIEGAMTKLVVFYPKHIEKEDKHFFLPGMAYFDKKELDAMLCEFREYDRKLIHEKYKLVVEEIEKDA